MRPQLRRPRGQLDLEAVQDLVRPEAVLGPAAVAAAVGLGEDVEAEAAVGGDLGRGFFCKDYFRRHSDLRRA